MLPPTNIESLLEHIESTDVPEDTMHRYELRRELLCSRYFDEHHQRQQKRNRFFTYTIPLMTGGMLVVVFLAAGVSLTQSTPQVAEIASVTTLPEIHPLSDSEKLQSTDFIDIREAVPLREVVQFVPVRTADYVMVR